MVARPPGSEYCIEQELCVQQAAVCCVCNRLLHSTNKCVQIQQSRAALLHKDWCLHTRIRDYAELHAQGRAVVSVDCETS